MYNKTQRKDVRIGGPQFAMLGSVRFVRGRAQAYRNLVRME